MRRTLLAALALGLLAGACASSGGSDGATSPSEGPTFAEVRLSDSTVAADTGRFELTVDTDPLRLSATLDGEPVWSEAGGGGLHLVRDGQVVDAEVASTTGTSEHGLTFDVTFADGSDGELRVSPVSEGAVDVSLLPRRVEGLTAWGERVDLTARDVVYGLEGPDPDPSPTPSLDRTGQVLTSPMAFHQTSEGYGLQVRTDEPVAYDVGATTPEVLELRVPLAPDLQTLPRFTLLVGLTAPDVLAARAATGIEVEGAVGEVGPATATQLQAELVALQEGSFVGVEDATSVAGGVPLAADDEVLLRSLQLAALTPVLSTAAPVDPTDPVHARYLALHEALGPYREGLAPAAEDEGLPLLRPLAFRYGDEREARYRWDEYLLGDDLLVAPVTEVGAVERSVWFPPGRWVSFWDHDQVVEGPLEQTVDAPLDTIPLFVREGSDLLELAVP
jgi:hypothetical protein